MGSPRRAASAAVALFALLAGVLTATDVATAAGPTDLTVRPSVNQLYVLDATPGQGLELVDESDTVVGTGTVDTAGSFAWRELFVPMASRTLLSSVASSSGSNAGIARLPGQLSPVWGKPKAQSCFAMQRSRTS